MSDRDAAPAAAEGADIERFRARAEATRRHADEHNCLDDGCYETGWLAGSRWQVARRAQAAAPREGGETFTEAELRTYAENLLAMGNGRQTACGQSILAMVQFLTTSHRQAAREAARGDAYEGTQHRPIVDASGHELVGDGTPPTACGEG